MTEKCHFIGIGGIGMSGLARLLLAEQRVVSGSDQYSNSLIDELQARGANVRIGHDARNVTADATIIYSSGIPENNPEYQEALKLKCKLLHRSDLLLALTHQHKVLGVVGTHGKTTTSALLSHVLCEANFEPSFAIGGILPGKKTNSQKGKGEYFVAELDESDGSFLKFQPYGAIITNIGSDHMDYFQTKEKLISDFKKFTTQVSSLKHLFWCKENMYLKEMSPEGISYGFNECSQLRIFNLVQTGWSICYDVCFEGKTYLNITIPLIGVHNALNSLAVFGLALSLGIEETVIRNAFNSFPGVSRRCELKGNVNEIIVLDDYAHHPTELSSTLNAIRLAVEEKRVILVYQPHRYTRVRDCLGSFAGIFDEADEVFLTDIYSAGETPIAGISYENILEENDQATPNIQYVPFDKIVQEVIAIAKPHDIIVTMGAGNITEISTEIVEALKKKRNLN